MESYHAADKWLAYEYSGAKLAIAELVGGADFGEPQRVAKAIADFSERQAFQRGVNAAYIEECVPAALKSWAEDSDGFAIAVYRQLCAS